MDMETMLALMAATIYAGYRSTGPERQALAVREAQDLWLAVRSRPGRS